MNNLLHLHANTKLNYSKKKKLKINSLSKCDNQQFFFHIVDRYPRIHFERHNIRVLKMHFHHGEFNLNFSLTKRLQFSLHGTVRYYQTTNEFYKYNTMQTSRVQL